MSIEGRITFEGPVECRDGQSSGLMLSGRSGSETLYVTFAGTPPLGLPARLDSPVIERIGEHDYRIGTGGEWRAVRAQGVFVHRDARQRLCAAVPARPAPLAKRLFWRAVLAFAATAAGRRMLGHRARDG